MLKRFQSSLKLYTVHVRPNDDDGGDDIRFVPEGFSFLAFFLNGFWAIYHRLWAMLAIFVVVNAAIGLGVQYLGLNPISLIIMQLGLQLWMGFEGYDFLRKRLRKDGFITSAIVSGETKARAEQRFFDSHSEWVNA
ncbi:MAG: DUF2628 domain-containing protein [Rickettsiales bacterium]|nr:DUF2628 domain-containing protein [Rickettsiales bacterium]